MHNLCAGDEARRLSQYRTLVADRTRVPIAAVEIMQPGQEREGDHAEQKRQHDGEIDLTGAQEYDHYDIRQLEKRGALAQKGRGNIHMRICEMGYRRSEHQHQVSADY